LHSPLLMRSCSSSWRRDVVIPNSSATSLTFASSLPNGWFASITGPNISGVWLTAAGPSSAVGGGLNLDFDRLRDNSTCAFFVCEGTRLGISGASNPNTSSAIAECLGAASKKLLSVAMGEDSADEQSGDVAGESRKLRVMDDMSESLADLIEEFDDEEFRLAMSGALKA